MIAFIITYHFLLTDSISDISVVKNNYNGIKKEDSVHNYQFSHVISSKAHYERVIKRLQNSFILVINYF